MPLGIDEFLDAIALALTDPETGVKELERDPKPTAEGEPPKLRNVQVWHHGENDPSEDIAASMVTCKGIHVLITDLGGDSDPNDASSPVIEAEVAVELFVDPSKRPRSNKALRLGGQIRDDIMQTLHLNPALLGGQHGQYDTKTRGYKPIADPDYTAWRITIQRSIYLHQDKS